MKKMKIIKDIENEIISNLSKLLKIDKKEIQKKLEKPYFKEYGDYAFPCFILAAKLKKQPVIIAEELSKKLIKKIKNVDIKALNGYINFYLDKKIIATEILNKILKEKEKYGSKNIGKKISIEHTSLNPNSSPHVGRARNSIIGDSLARIFKFLGYKVETYYYVNDVSKQIAMIALKFKGKENFSQLLDLYIKVNKEIKNDPELENKVFDLLEKFEKGNKKVKEKFRKIVKIALEGQKKILKEFGIIFDRFDYESSYIKKAKKILEEFKKTKRLFIDENGRFVLNEEGYNLEGKIKSPVLVLARSNGTALYALRDIAYTIDKMKRCDESYIVLGEDQKIYFHQLKIALEILGKKAPKVIHYSYVLIEEDGKIKKQSTRSGDVILLEDFMKEAVKKAQEEINKRKTKGDAKKIGYGAVKYAIIKQDPNKNIIFKWKDALNFDGNSGPYLQYSYARASSIIKKSRIKIKKISIENLNDYEINLIKKLSDFPLIVEEAYKHLNPSILANYSFELCKIFNEFYHNCNVLKAEKKDKGKRIAIIEAFRIVLKNSLSLLGIEVIENM
ncbi:MAG: arginine--tRNA ligase [Candidatus Pacearchaeota archaeon]